MADVTRLEVIDHRNSPDVRGRVLVLTGVQVEPVYQDDGQTLKIFVTDQEDKDG